MSNSTALLARRGNVLIVLLLLLAMQQLAQAGMIKAKAHLAPLLIERAWAASLSLGNGAPVKPWPWADTWPVARLKAESGAIDLIVLSGGSGRTLAFGPGHLPASALPGKVGNAVIAGHRDTHFGFLQNTTIGDNIEIETQQGQTLRYAVTATEVVDSRSGSVLLDTDHPTLSLITCYPFDAVDAGGPMRYVVTARMLY